MGLRMNVWFFHSPRPPACQKDFFDKLSPAAPSELPGFGYPWESSRGPKPSRTSNRARRRVRQKGCLPEGQASRFATGKATSKIQVCPPRGLFSRRKIPFSGSKNRYLADFAPGDSERILAETVKAENPLGFQVSPEAKLPTAKSKILTRHRGGGRKAENPLGFQVLPLAKLPRLKSKI